MSKTLLIFLLAFYSIQNAYGTCVVNNSNPPQNITYKVNWSACGGQDYESTPIQQTDDFIKTCSLNPLIKKQPECTVKIEIVGSNTTLHNCKIIGDPRTIGASTFQVYGVGCKIVESETKSP